MPIAAALPYIAATAAVGGVALAAKGQSDAKKAAAAANAQAQENSVRSNDSAWQSYLMSRGINPMGATSGNMPTNPQALNVKLPLYANVDVVRSPGSTVPTIRGITRRTSTPAPSTNWWNVPDVVQSGGGSGRSWSGLGIAA